MSSLIEQAAQRLEQLRRAGASLPSADQKAGERLPGGGQAAAVPLSESHPPPAPAQAAAPTSRVVDLPLESLLAAGLLVPGAPRTQLADQFRVIKRPLIRNAVGRGAAKIAHGNLIMITSALAGEGKSFTSVNLALSIANELDHTVMLVDADVARPSIGRMLGIATSPDGADGPGLLDVLDGRVDMAQALLRTNVPKLTVLPSGARHERATEMLASDAMSRLLDGIALRYPDRIVIFDSPPLLQTTEARVLATHMGQVVLVVRAEETAQAAVQEALATIEACPVRMLLLNRARVSAGAGYGYGYGYGYGSSAGQTILEAPTG